MAATRSSAGIFPLAAGLAFASKYQKQDLVTVCFFGEGAVPSGQAHEAFNLAALWKLPVILSVRIIDMVGDACASGRGLV